MHVAWRQIWAWNLRAIFSHGRCFWSFGYHIPLYQWHPFSWHVVPQRPDELPFLSCQELCRCSLLLCWVSILLLTLSLGKQFSCICWESFCESPCQWHVLPFGDGGRSWALQDICDRVHELPVAFPPKMNCCYWMMKNRSMLFVSALWASICQQHRCEISKAVVDSWCCTAACSWRLEYCYEWMVHSCREFFFSTVVKRRRSFPVQATDKREQENNERKNNLTAVNNVFPEWLLKRRQHSLIRGSRAMKQDGWDWLGFNLKCLIPGSASDPKWM